MEKKPETVGLISPVAGETDEVQDNTEGILAHQKERNTGNPEPHTSGENSRKRKVKFESGEKVPKRLKWLRLKKRSLRKNQAEGKCCHPSGPSLTDLPDELLLVVLRSLPPRDVHSLGQVSSRFANVVADHTLWVSPDFRHQRGLTCEKFCERYMPFLGPWTTSMATRGALQSLRARSETKDCRYRKTSTFTALSTGVACKEWHCVFTPDDSSTEVQRIVQEMLQTVSDPLVLPDEPAPTPPPRKPALPPAQSLPPNRRKVPPTPPPKPRSRRCAVTASAGQPAFPTQCSVSV